MKASELRTKKQAELQTLLGENLRNLMGLRFKKVAHEVKDTSVMRKTRKLVARIKTVMSEKQDSK